MKGRVLFLLWVVGIYFVALALFTNGFLLTRRTLTQVSPSKDPSLRSSPPLFNKLILLVIDAFKYEFALYDNNTTTNYYLNQFPVSEALLQNEYGVLMEAMADPPTTTMQRLKGLTTGSLPTFIDISKNFGSYVVEEDNWIDQLFRNNKSVVFAGDDTWLSLYPEGFRRSYPFPSFNIRDLDTVDRGVYTTLKTELGKKDWDVFIGHFLGVDHAGHSYGPNHSEMSRKLGEMSEIVSYVSQNMSEDTVLFVLGDHGMTKTGDHGGDSKDEMSSTFMVFNKKYRFKSKMLSSLSQIDFLPTACLWMGLPIPFSNLGSFLPLIEDNNYNHNFLKTNVEQVMSFFDGYFLYGNSRSEFSRKQVRDLENMFSNFKSRLKQVMSVEEMRLSQELGFKILQYAKRMCQSVWAKFDFTTMVAGLTLLIIHTTTMFLMLQIQDREGFFKEYEVLVHIFISGLCGAGIIPAITHLFLPEIEFSYVFVFASASAASVTVFSFHILWKLRKGFIFKFDHKSKWCLVLCLGTLCLSGSNSFVVEEPYVLNFMMITLILFITFSSSSGYFLRCVIVFVAILMRCSNVYFICREEQETNWDCSISLDFTKSIGDLPQEVSKSMKDWRFFSTLFSVLCVSVLPQFWLKRCGNLNGMSLVVTIINYAPPSMGMCMVSYWALRGSRLSAKILPWQQNILAQAVFSLWTIATILIVHRPTLVYYDSPEDKLRKEFPRLPHREASSIYKLLKAQWDKMQSSTPLPTKTVYGLGTALSAPIIAILICTSLSSMMILGDGPCPSVVGMLCIMTLVLVLNALDNAGNSVQTSSILLWWLSQNFFFYSSGHNATISSIKFNAAFEGFDGTTFGKESFILPFLIILWNTYVSRILFGFALPLLFLSPYTIPLVMPGVVTASKEEEKKKGELMILEAKLGAPEAQLLILVIRYIVISAIQLFFPMVSAAILSRHLMVWKIFTPKFVFEGVGFIVTCFSVTVGYLVWTRIYDAMSRYYAKLSLVGKL